MNPVGIIRWVLSAAVVALMVMPAPAMAAFPGDNGKLVYAGYGDESLTQITCTSTVSGAEDCFWELGFAYSPAWSPDGLKILIQRFGLETVNQDGTDPQQVIPYSEAESIYGTSWSPDGTKILFERDRDGNWEIYYANLDGSGQTRLTNNAATDAWGRWSPDGSKIVFSSDRDGNSEIYVMNADGTGQTRITNNPAADYSPDWSPDGSSLTFVSTRDGNGEVYKMKTDGSDPTRLTNSAGNEVSPVWSPDGTKIAFAHNRWFISTVNPDGTDRTQLFATHFANEPGDIDMIDWQPLLRGYVRPRGATPTRVPLVPAAKQCTSPNSTHGAPLSFPSCSPPQTETSATFLGIGDGNPSPARSIGHVLLRVLDGSATPGDDSDLQIRLQITHVMRPDRSDYPGELRLELPLRITDRFNRPHPNVTGPGTVADTSFYATVPCTTTPSDALTGSTCALTSTADAILPATVREGARSVWGLGQVKLHDGGADEDADTAADNQLLAVQGVFVP